MYASTVGGSVTSMTNPNEDFAFEQNDFIRTVGSAKVLIHQSMLLPEILMPEPYRMEETCQEAVGVRGCSDWLLFVDKKVAGF